MNIFIVAKDDCFLVKAAEIPDIYNTQLYADMSAVSRLYPYGKSEKSIIIDKNNLITVVWKNVHRGILMKPSEDDRRIFKILTMHNEDKYFYTSPAIPKSEILIRCINN